MHPSSDLGSPFSAFTLEGEADIIYKIRFDNNNADWKGFKSVGKYFIVMVRRNNYASTDNKIKSKIQQIIHCRK